MPAGERYGGVSARARKLGPLVLTLALHALVIALLLFHRSMPIPRTVEQSLTTIFLPASKPEQADASKARTQRQAKEAAREAPKPATSPPDPPKPEPSPAPVLPNYLTMTSAEFAAADISRMPSHSRSRGSATQEADSEAAYGPGEGPGGARLYEADWYRKPSDAELAGYLPANRPRRGWGLIACRTIEDYRVDDCRTLGESPLGSGFGRAVREAAWQFRVLPPRINGKPMVGSWVRIRIEYGEREGPG
ncbi:hypothetical protein [Sphingobium lignivorans]|uniref:Protein TonB n=1 Tax=Sphingobium lignivorans TaxID=2735886 RepID=A0ABR6NA67_9SPHN|nr:hypothetical protein [Sphingobium lignivorans]MBB5984154.1 protein TonB [Sphingobium lignivorans]